MSLNRGQVNPLNVLGYRKLNFIPKHFASIILDYKVNAKAIEQWIEYHLNGRYGVNIKPGLDENKKIVSLLEIGFEDPAELTMLSLACNHLHKK